MSLVEKLCKELGVEVGEKWIGNDNKEYAIRPNGQLLNFKENSIDIGLDCIERVLRGELKPIWKPKLGETYYVPSITMEDKYIALTWTETEGDKRNQERGAVFKTKEEAIEMGNKMLKIAKEEIIEMGNKMLNVSEEERKDEQCNFNW